MSQVSIEMSFAAVSMIRINPLQAVKDSCNGGSSRSVVEHFLVIRLATSLKSGRQALHRVPCSVGLRLHGLTLHDLEKADGSRCFSIVLI